jgi:protein O-mannosyl-transferase
MQIETGTRSEIEPRRADRTRMFRLLLLAAILAAFGRTLFNDFVDWDDSKLIYANPNIANPTTDGLLRQWNPDDPDHLAMYNPLVYTVWWTLAHAPRLSSPNLLGTTLNPLPYHAANLLVHWLTACLVLEILRRIGLPPWPAAIGALLFAIHPLQTEAVAWATGMKDLLSGFFVMAAILAYLRAATPGPRQFLFFAASTLLCLAALLAKPSAVVLPLIVIVFDVVLLGRSVQTSVRLIAPWFVLAGITIVIAKQIQPATDIQSGPLWARPFIAADSLTFYLTKLVVPLHLTFEYGRTPAAVLSDPALNHPLYWTWIIPLALALIIWKIHRPTVTLAGLVFVFGVLPVLGLIPFEFQYHSTVADRYVYVSMLGAAIAAAALLFHYRNHFTCVVAGGILLVFASLSFAQAGRWKNTETLYEYGRQFRAATPLHLFVLGQYKDKESEIAERNSQTDLQKTYLAQAIADYNDALAMDPQFAQVYRNLTVDLVRTGRIAEAIDVTLRRIEIQPKLDETTRDKPASLHATLGMLYFRTEDYAKAAAEFERSLQYEPNPQVKQKLEEARQHLPPLVPSPR